MTIRSFLFMRRHRKACQRITDSARELARIGHEKRRLSIAEQTQRLRRELGLPDDPRLA